MFAGQAKVAIILFVVPRSVCHEMWHGVVDVYSFVNLLVKTKWEIVANELRADQSSVVSRIFRCRDNSCLRWASSARAASFCWRSSSSRTVLHEILEDRVVNGIGDEHGINLRPILIGGPVYFWSIWFRFVVGSCA